MKDFTKIFQLKGLKPKNNGHTNFHECFTKKVHLVYIPSGRYRGGVGAALTARSTIATTFWLSKTESIENELMKKRAN